VQTGRGEAASGPLLELGAQWCARLGGTPGVQTEADDLIELRRVGRALPPLPAGEQLLFVNGDRIPGRVVRLVGERVVFRPLLAGKPEEKDVAVPLSALAVIWLETPDSAAGAGEVLRRRLVSQKQTRDVVLLRNGDAIEGVLNAFDDKEVQIEVEKKVVEVRRDRVAVIALNTALAATLRPKGPYARLVLAGGARLSLATAACDGQTLTGTTLFQSAIRIPLREVAALYLFQGKAVYLSDLRPARQEHASYLPTALPGRVVVDGSSEERDLRLRGSTYDRGLGVQSDSRLTYELAGGYRRFEALVGLDDHAGVRGSVRVRVLVDGKASFDKELTARSSPLPVRVEVAGAKELTLVVEAGKGGNVHDFVNWVDTRLIR
jgi:hypothetical protein